MFVSYPISTIFGSTCIFTFDSLGSRHPQAIKLLKAYLRLEAEDKKQVTRTSEAVGKQAQVSDLLCLSEVVDQIHSAYKRCLCNRTIAIVAYTSFTSLKHSCWIQKSIAK